MQTLATMAGVGTTQTLAQKQGIDMSNKGSFGNRMQCAGEQYVNMKKGLVKDELTLAAGGAATIAATAGVAKSKSAQNILTKGFESIKNTKFGKVCADLASEATPYVKKGVDWVKNLPKPAKAVLAAGTAITALFLSNNDYKTGIKAGQIDQKYTDKAKLEKVLG